MNEWMDMWMGEWVMISNAEYCLIHMIIIAFETRVNLTLDIVGIIKKEEFFFLKLPNRGVDSIYNCQERRRRNEAIKKNKKKSLGKVFPIIYIYI